MHSDIMPISINWQENTKPVVMIYFSILFGVWQVFQAFVLMGAQKASLTFEICRSESLPESQSWLTNPQLLTIQLPV